MRAYLVLLGLIVFPAFAIAQAPAKQKRVPPQGIPISDSDRQELAAGIAELDKFFDDFRRRRSMGFDDYLADVKVFHKAVDWALRYDEFMDPKQVASAKRALAEGLERARSLSASKIPWMDAKGPVLHGYVSRIDGSVQPYALLVPEDFQQPMGSKARPLLVWLSGRNDKRTELAFLDEHWKSRGEFTPPGAFVLFPYGRFCNATKFAGETDVFEAIEAVRERYRIDPLRIAVGGFSMGGASCWHLATHHAGLWCAATSGAGFAETAVYAKVFAAGKEPPPWWEQMLWAHYDATKVAANLKNTSIIAYSGELDPQKQSADIMEQACASEGIKLERIIGPQTAHKYEPGAKKEIAAKLDEWLATGRQAQPRKVHLTTYTLRYNRMNWLTVDALEKHWHRADVDGEIAPDQRFNITTKNVAGFSIALAHTPASGEREPRFTIDGQELIGLPSSSDRTVRFSKSGATWKPMAETEAASTGSLAKKYGLTGPIDDAFTDHFIFVRPTGEAWNAAIGAWSTTELQRAIEQWRLVFRGEAIVKDDTALTPSEIAQSNLILWGDPGSNKVLSQILSKLPVQWTREKLTMGKLSLEAAHHAPVLIYPNPLNPQRYVVLNSGFTFREGSTISNSLQTPKLPDWALINVEKAPNDRTPGQIIDAGFFDEQWRLPNK